MQAVSPHELLLVDWSIQLDRPQRRLCRRVSFLSVEQCSRCWTWINKNTVQRRRGMGECIWKWWVVYYSNKTANKKRKMKETC